MIEVASERVLLHPSIHCGIAQVLPDLNRLPEPDRPDAEGQQPLQQVVHSDVGVSNGQHRPDVLLGPVLQYPNRGVGLAGPRWPLYQSESAVHGRPGSLSLRLVEVGSQMCGTGTRTSELGR